MTRVPGEADAGDYAGGVKVGDEKSSPAMPIAEKSMACAKGVADFVHLGARISDVGRVADHLLQLDCPGAAHTSCFAVGA
jgi:hypothetical protein